jgi:hypothetical protein
MDAKQLHDFLDKEHELEISAKESLRNEVEESEYSEPLMKKRNTGNIGRRIALEPKPLNAKICEDIKAGKKVSANVE